MDSLAPSVNFVRIYEHPYQVTITDGARRSSIAVNYKRTLQVAIIDGASMYFSVYLFDFGYKSFSK